MPGTCCSGLSSKSLRALLLPHTPSITLYFLPFGHKKSCLLPFATPAVFMPLEIVFERCKGNTFFLFKERFSKIFFIFFRRLSLSKPPVFLTKILKIKQLNHIFQHFFINIFFVFFNNFSKKTAIFAKLLRQHYCGFLFIFFHGRHPLPAFFSFLRGRCANRPLYTSSLQARLRQAQPPAGGGFTQI